MESGEDYAPYKNFVMVGLPEDSIEPQQQRSSPDGCTVSWALAVPNLYLGD